MPGSRALIAHALPSRPTPPNREPKRIRQRGNAGAPQRVTRDDGDRGGSFTRHFGVTGRRDHGDARQLLDRQALEGARCRHLRPIWRLALRLRLQIRGRDDQKRRQASDQRGQPQP